ncbi:isopenicillin N synthase family dioxygenase [Hyphococcus sp.]|uniref:isopenicillin N synthase family dioxygenase n=1 Tax=Hyphococcus sp. TaxID=2038636 RepID=UPI0020803BFE|nr:MAG: oxidoreductase [Marinicaulis sp.]
MPRKYDRVPELSLKAYTDGDIGERRKFEQALFEGFKYFGFIILKDHKVSHDLLQRAYAKSAEFFALAESDKTPFFRTDGQRGYTPFGREHAKDSKHPDLKEFWHVGREFEAGSPLEDIYPPNMWPPRPAGFRETFLELFDALEEAGMVMLEALAPSLDVPRDYFRKMATDGNSILRLLHYPPVPEGVNPNAIRAAAHEDINLITILVAANGGGLQLLDRDGKWLPVETDPDNLIVDAGDMLARVCNDIIPATTHRVINPEGGPNESRYSMPFFMHPHSNALLSCLDSCKGDGVKYEDITADDFLKQRLREIGLAG